MLAGLAVAQADRYEPEIGCVAVVVNSQAICVVTEVEVCVAKSYVRCKSANACFVILLGPDTGTEGVRRYGSRQFVEAVVLGNIILAVEPGDVAQVRGLASKEAAIEAQSVVVSVIACRCRCRIAVYGTINVRECGTGYGVVFLVEV